MSCHSSLCSLHSSIHWPASLSSCAPSCSQSGSHFPALSPQIATNLALSLHLVSVQMSPYRWHLAFLTWESSPCPSPYFSPKQSAPSNLLLFTCLLLSVPSSLEWELHEGRNSICFIYWGMPSNQNNVCRIVYTLNLVHEWPLLPPFFIH